MLNKSLSIFIGALLLGVSIVLARPHWVEFWAVDSCLDSGGSYNYKEQECDDVKSHPNEPSYSKHGLSVVAAVVSGTVGLMLIFSIRGNRKGNAL